MLRVNFEFIRLENKLTGFRLIISTSTKSFKTEYCWKKPQLAKPLRVCFEKRYLPDSLHTERDTIEEFRKVVAYLGS